MAAWLDRKGSASPSTLAAYRREVSRLLLWAAELRGKALSDLGTQDYRAYQRFLGDPQPRDRWVADGGRKWALGAPGWRPFYGDLTAQSQEYALRVIRDLLSFLAQAGYLIGNPLALINICAHAHNESVAVQRARAPRRRALGRRLWIRLQSAVNNWPEKTPQAQFEKARARWMLTLMYALGPRISDLRGSFGDIHREAVGDRDLWIWSIAGKGGKFAQLPLPSPVVDEMVRFRKSIGIPAFPVDGETTPLVPRSTDTNRNRPLTRQGLDRIVRQTLDSAAQQAYDDGDPEAAERLSRASAHALRHTAATDILESGVDMRVAADLMRHSDIRTTQGYTTPELSRLMDALDQRDLEWRDH